MLQEHLFTRISYGSYIKNSVGTKRQQHAESNLLQFHTAAVDVPQLYHVKHHQHVFQQLYHTIQLSCLAFNL